MRGRRAHGLLIVVVGVIAAGCASATSAGVATTIEVTATLDAATATPTTSEAPSTTATTAPTTASTTATTVDAREPIVLGFAGDTTFTDGLDQRDPFGQIVDLTSAPDLMVVNLETAVADPGVGRPPVDKRFLFKSPPSSLDLLVDAGIDVVALANNHTLDYGPDALAQTLDEIDRRDLARVGAGLDESAAYEPLFMEVGDWTVGLVSLSRVPCDWSASGDNVRPQVAWACPTLFDRAESSARSAMAQADVTVVMIHGGEEGVLCPSPFMLDLEAAFADMGVDAVINGHPHVFQGLTRRSDTWVAHSLGNFAFPPSRGITGNSAIVQLHVSEDGIAMSLVPVRSDGGVLSIPSDVQRSDILNQVNRYSQGVTVADDGSVTVDDGNRGAC